MYKQREPDIWYGLVTPEDQLLSEGEVSWAPRTRKSWGMVESVAKPVKEYSGSVRGHGGGTIRHARFDSSRNAISIKHGGSGSVSSIKHNSVDDEHAVGQVGEAAKAG